MASVSAAGLRAAAARKTVAASRESLFARRGEGSCMVRSRTVLVIAGLLLVASAAGAAGYFYFRLSRSEAALLGLLVLSLGLLQTASLLWIARPTRPQAVRAPA